MLPCYNPPLMWMLSDHHGPLLVAVIDGLKEAAVKTQDQVDDLKRVRGTPVITLCVAVHADLAFYLVQELANREAELDEADADYEHLKEDHDDKERTVTELEDTIEELRRDLANKDREADERLAEITKQLADSRSAVVQLEV